MPDDPLEPFRKIQQHLDALRRAQRGIPPNVNLTNPGVNVRYSFKTAGPPSGFSPPVPDPLIDWLLEDLPPRAFHDLVTETAAHQKLKGYRPGHLPRAEGLRLLKKRYEKDPPFRGRAAREWLQGREKEDQAFRLLKAPDIRRNPWPVVEKFGFPLAVWLMFLSSGGQFRAVALQILKEVTAREGKLQEILTAAARNAPPPKDLLALPAVSHDDEIARIQSEVEQILSERDRWQAEAKAEKETREKFEAELRKARDENQRLSQARSGAEQARQALEVRTRELEKQIEDLRSADATIRRLEKALKEAEREASRAKVEREKFRAAEAAVTAERNELKVRLRETETAMSLLSHLAEPFREFDSPPYRGEVLLVVSNAEPGAFYEAGKHLGLTVLVHNGAAKDAQFDKFLLQAKAVWWLGSPEHGGLTQVLRDSGKNYALLPAMDAAGFERLAASAKEKLKKMLS